MIEMTLYGRGGQGGVTLAKLIATAYFLRGKYSQAFGVYAAERSGAPIQAYVRVDDEEITNHNQIRLPDHVIVLDPTLIGDPILAGLDPEGWIILNTHQPASAWADVFPGRRLATIDATEIAIENGLGTRTVPIVNTTLMGAVARVFEISFDEVEKTFAELGFAGANLVAARQAFERVELKLLPGQAERVQPGRPVGPVAGILDADVGGAPKIKTGSWATRKPDRRTMTPPCNHTCPAGNDVQRFVQHVSREEYSEALRVILETSPLPGICGRVCPAPCMEVCNRNLFDEGINVRELERYVADHGEWPEAAKPWRRERVAVVGSGPAGLSAAYQLARLGYPVSLFEAADELGGVLRNGIPDYRLPKDVLNRELDFILDHGLTVYTDEFVDRKTLLRLTTQYEGVFIATGLQSSRGLNLGADKADEVMQGIDFLDAVHRREISLDGENVVVAGGGNTAIDAARSAVRLGAKNVTILYRRTRNEMPAIDEEIDAALEEGVILNELVLPERLTHDGTLLCVRMKLGEPDESGRRSPVRDDSPNAQFTVECDRVILALGQSADLSILEEGAEIREGGELLGVAGAPVFLGGDFGTNEGTVTAAIGSGRRAATHIHRRISGISEPETAEAPVAGPEAIRTHLFEHGLRERGVALNPTLRRESFAEVHVGLDDAQGRAAAALEAQRCFSCGVCNTCDNCLDHCPEGILTRDGQGYRFNYEYCKGCGICASECPRGVVFMAELQ